MELLRRKLETYPICVRIPKRNLEHMHRLARKMAAEQDRDITFHDLIRDAVSRMYPIEEAAPEGKNPIR